MSTKRLKQKYNDFLFDHEKIKLSLEVIKILFACLLSAIIYTFGYRCFILNDDPNLCLVAGGMSGFAQIIVKILELIGATNPKDIARWQPLFSYGLNIPIFIIGWKFIGKRFAIYTFITVLFISLGTYLMPQSVLDTFNLSQVSVVQDINSGQEIAKFVDPNFLPRVLFGGICTGVASVIAFKNGTSTGGLDVVSLAVANRKSTSIGKYLITFNGFVLLGYTACSYFQNSGSALRLFLYSAIYLFVNALVTDYLNSRYKKAQIQIVTRNENIANILIANFPHGCTIVNGKGAFSKENRFIISMVVSSHEINKVVQIIQRVDPAAFVNVTMLYQVYGKFYIEPYK